MIDVGTKMWLTGLVILACSLGFAVAGLLGATVGLGAALALLGALVDLTGEQLPDPDRRRDREVV